MVKQLSRQDHRRLREGSQLSALSKLTAVALVCAGLVFLWLMWLAGGFESDLLTLFGLALATAAIATIRRRWALLPGSLFSAFITFLGPIFQPFTRSHLVRPEQFDFFAATLLLEAFGLVASVAGFSGTWQNYRNGQRDRLKLPRWFAFFLTGLAGVVVGALAVGLVAPASTTSTTSSTSSQAATVLFVAQDIAYTQAPDQMPAGEVVITLENRGAIVHNVAFESVNGANPVVEVIGGMTATGTVSLQAGTYTYFCTIAGHREAGMEGQVTAS
ncbi:MAG: cupredoxin domain-containing protein [Egibacteraceae bacterium]